MVMKAWGFEYKSNLVWHKIRKDGGSDGRGVGFYFRNVTELILFGVRGKNARTQAAGRRQVNLLATRKREHSRKPDEQYEIIEACSRGPYVELFARGMRKNGYRGAIKPMMDMNRNGKPTHTTLLPKNARLQPSCSVANGQLSGSASLSGSVVGIASNVWVVGGPSST
jgi:hypothetical protein